jgi:hypothetical protein
MTDTLVQGFAELTLEVRDRERLERFRRLDAVRRRLDEGRREGADALGDEDHSPNPSHKGD